jgi:hypothetical protein
MSHATRKMQTVHIDALVGFVLSTFKIHNLKFKQSLANSQIDEVISFAVKWSVLDII